MGVLGVRRSQAPFLGLDGQFSPNQLAQAVPQANHVALCLPLIRETRDIIGEARLRMMKSSAFIYDVGCGGSIGALARRHALAERWIAGAGLDVTDLEPLPDDVPRRDMPNVILSQHTSGSSPYNADRITAMFAENLGRYPQVEKLIDLVDRDLGY